MKSDELIKVLNDKKSKIKEIDSKITKLKEDEKKIIDTIMRSTAFIPRRLAFAISYLVLAKEEKLYIPINGSNMNEYGLYYYIILVNANELKKYPSLNICAYSDIIPIYSAEIGKSNYDNQELTFSHLRKKFELTVDLIKEYNFKCNIHSFVGHEYIKDYITYIAMLQLKKDGESLTKEEMLIAVSDFLNLKKDKPKTKELSKN